MENILDYQEQESHFEYAGFGKRLAAFIIDRLLIAVVWIPFVIVLVYLDEEVVQDDDLAALYGLLTMFSYLLIMWLYNVIMHSSERQATFGKRWMKIKVCDTNNQRITFARANGRFFARIITRMIPFYIGYLMAAFTTKNQAMHDTIANTIVVESNQLSDF